jgi:hypothetical protein
MKKDLEIQERQKFIDVYSDFDKWLFSLGFRTANTKESMSVLNYHFRHYDKQIDSLYSVECYMHDILKMSLRFMRDRNEHKFMFVGEMGAHSEILSTEQTKHLILTKVREERDERLNKLNSLIHL